LKCICHYFQTIRTFIDNKRICGSSKTKEETKSSFETKEGLSEEERSSEAKEERNKDKTWFELICHYFETIKAALKSLLLFDSDDITLRYGIKVDSCLGKIRAFVVDDFVEEWQHPKYDPHNASKKNDLELIGYDQQPAVPPKDLSRRKKREIFVHQLRDKQRVLAKSNRKLKRMLLVIDPQLDSHTANGSNDNVS